MPFYAEQSDTFHERHRYWWDFELSTCQAGTCAAIPLGHPGRLRLYPPAGSHRRPQSRLGHRFPALCHRLTPLPRVLDRLLEGVPDDERRLIVGGNAVEFHKLAA